VITCHGVSYGPEIGAGLGCAYNNLARGISLQSKLAALIYLFSERYMTTYIALRGRELFSSNKTALHGIVSSSGTSDSLNGDGECHSRRRLRTTVSCQLCHTGRKRLTPFFSVRSTPLPSEDRPPKRARATSNKSRTNDRARPSKRVRGRLSELPTMPLDIVYEVRETSLSVELAKFGMPSLSRYSDIFCPPTCSHLVASTELSVTFSCLADLRPCGEHLIASFPVFQPAPKICPSQRGLICSLAVLIAMCVVSDILYRSAMNSNGTIQSCGAKPVTKILFSLRRRACRSCMKAQYVVTSFQACSSLIESV